MTSTKKAKTTKTNNKYLVQNTYRWYDSNAHTWRTNTSTVLVEDKNRAFKLLRGLMAINDHLKIYRGPASDCFVFINSITSYRAIRVATSNLSMVTTDGKPSLYRVCVYEIPNTTSRMRALNRYLRNDFAGH